MARNGVAQRHGAAGQRGEEEAQQGRHGTGEKDVGLIGPPSAEGIGRRVPPRDALAQRVGNPRLEQVRRRRRRPRGPGVQHGGHEFVAAGRVRRDEARAHERPDGRGEGVGVQRDGGAGGVQERGERGGARGACGQEREEFAVGEGGEARGEEGGRGLDVGEEGGEGGAEGAGERVGEGRRGGRRVGECARPARVQA